MTGKTVSHYCVLEKIEEGGMGIIYKAEDTKLKRRVALKFLPHKLTSDEEARQRFKREARAAAALNHPNIVTVYEIGEHEGQVFIAMEYVDGKTLKELISANPLPITQVIDIAAQIAEGLSAAHAKDIVHRDIKPQNILIDKEGRVKILDFGLAKLKGVSSLTKESSILGTVHYMSPEQTMGREVDHRTDIWSLGVVLYEMLTGELPFKGDYEQAVIYSILNENPRFPASMQKCIPIPMENIIAKLLEKSPDNRFQEAAEVVRQLRYPEPRLDRTSRKDLSIVVLPFINMSPDQDQEYFSDGLTEEIISDLSGIRGLKVISRTSAMMLKSTRKDMKTIGRELKVKYVLEGSVRKASGRLRITAQLIDAEEDAHVWADKYDGILDDVFAIQEKVSRAIVDALQLTLSPGERQRLERHPMKNPVAYEHYLKAYHEIWKFSESGLDRAREYLEHGLEIIGDNAFIFSALSFVHWQYANIGARQEEAIAKAEEYATQALRIDPDFPKALTCLGYLERDFFGRMKHAIDHFKRAIDLNPNELEAVHGLAAAYCWSGKLASARILGEKMMEIDPLNPFTHFMQAIIHYLAGDFAAAAQRFGQTYRLDVQNAVFQHFYALALACGGREEEAIAFIGTNTAVDSSNTFSILTAMLGDALKKEKSGALARMSADFVRTCKRDFGFSYLLSQRLALLNESERAMDWLENAVAKGFLNYPFLQRHDPLLQSIRGNARFQRISEQVRGGWESFAE
jgi:serine/threonine protein kinase/tetratricopeptide (TPR) repeat protein